MGKFVIVSEESRGCWVNCWLVDADDKHKVISKAVEAGYSKDFNSFYHGLEDGQIYVFNVDKEYCRDC